MLVAVHLPAELGKGSGLGEDRGPKRGTERTSPEQSQNMAVKTLKAILVSLSLGRWSRPGTSWEIMKEQSRVWAAILTLCCLCSFLNYPDRALGDSPSA